MNRHLCASKHHRILRVSALSLLTYLCSLSPLVAQQIPFFVIPAGGETSVLPFEILTVGEPIVFDGAGPISGLGFSHTIVFVPPPAFDPAPLLSNLFGACRNIQVSGTPEVTGNLQANGKVTVSGNAVVTGDIMAGKFKRTGKSKVNGTVTVAPNTLDCLPIALAPFLDALEFDGKGVIPPEFLQDGALVLDAQETLVLSTGMYLLSGLSITGGATLLTNGTVNLLVRGPITVAGHSFTNQSETTNFVVFSDSSSPVEIVGKAAFHGIVYAPFADLAIAGTSDARGHFFANNIQASGMTIDVANPPEVGTLMATGYVSGDGGTISLIEVEDDDKQRTKAAVIVPQKALKTPGRLTISRETHKTPEEKTRKEASRGKQNLKAISEGMDYGPEGTVFDKPVIISIAYDVETLPVDVREDDLRICYWNPSTQEWEEMPDSQVDKIAKRVAAPTEHFSLYKILGSPSEPVAGPPPGPDTTFALGEVYVFPSPAVGGAAPMFHVETGIAERVMIRVYDISGQRVHETTLTGTPGTVDDGQGPQYAYEYPWQARIASGVYLYVVTSEKGGEKLVKTGKFAVIR